MTGFDRPTLDLLRRAREIRIETERPDGSPRRTVIWVVVDGDEVFVRSVRGDRGAWYQAARDRPAAVAVHVAGRRILVRARPAIDEGSVGRCSAALASKYAADPSTPSMLRPAILGTTLRLEPR